MEFIVAAVAALLCTLGFDFLKFKWDEKKEMEASWKALNEKLEREGKQRWDERE